MKPIIAEKLSNVNYRIMMDMAYTGEFTLGQETNKSWFSVRKVNNERAANFEAINLN